jgi:UDP-glucose 4-epimerase
MEPIKTHTHDGINSEKLKTYNVIPTFIMTATELTRYLSRPAIEGEEFNVYDGTNYRKYIRINKLWKYITLS